MKWYLLDAHLIDWWATGDEWLGKATRDPRGAIGEQLQAQGFVLLAIIPHHLEAVRRMICAYADPLDRLLIAQAKDQRLTLLTRDAAILELKLGEVERA